MAKVSVITCTGGRSDVFALCKAYLENQTYTDRIEWIVVDDTTNMIPETLGVPTGKNVNIQRINVAAPIAWRAGLNTQRFNMWAALEAATGDYIFTLEDDDFYNPYYIERLLFELERYHVVGLCAARYYHIGFPGFKYMDNCGHASLSQTALRRSALPLLQEAVDSGELYIDSKFWTRVHETGTSYALIGNTSLSVGIKGMPGRPGITGSHRDLSGYQKDSDLVKLKQWLGLSAELYLPYIKGTSHGKENEKTPRIQSRQKENPVRRLRS